MFQEEQPVEVVDPQVIAISKRVRVQALEVRELCEKGTYALLFLRYQFDFVIKDRNDKR